MPRRSDVVLAAYFAAELRRRAPRTVYAYAHTFLPVRFHGARDRRHQFRDNPETGK